MREKACGALWQKGREVLLIDRTESEVLALHNQLILRICFQSDHLERTAVKLGAHLISEAACYNSASIATDATLVPQARLTIAQGSICNHSCSLLRIIWAGLLMEAAGPC